MKIGVYGSLHPDEGLIIKNTSDLRSYFFIKELIKKGHTVIFKKFAWEVPYFSESLDHFICTINGGGLFRMPNKIGVEPWDVIRKYTKGKILEVSGNKSSGNIKSDIFLINIPGDHKNPKIRCIGWSADPDLCFPKKKLPFFILVDHTLYHEGQDETRTILEGLKKVHKKGFPIIVKRLCNEGVQTVDFSKNISYEMFKRENSIPYKDVCDLYCKAHMFFVTHAESVGHSVIENAMAGAVIAAFPGAIKSSLIKPLNHIFYTPKDPHSVYKAVVKTIKKINIEENRKKALPFSWENSIEKVIEILKE